MTGGTLIVGASHAGVQVAASLREQGYPGDITLVGAEQWRPYQRPPLSKAYLAGTATQDLIALRSNDFFSQQGITIKLGRRVMEVDLNAQKAALSDGTRLAFDHVALAVGARARRLTVPGSDLSGVLYLRNMADANALAAALPAATSVVVIGGGFIGLEAAAVARQYGKTVTIVESSPRLIARAVAPVVSEFYRNAHHRRGATVVLGRTVRFLDSGPDQRVSAVGLDDGTIIPANLVLVGIGVEPRTELAEQIGLEISGGIVVDEHSRTSDPRVVATGDCTTFPGVHDPTTMIRLESVQNAVDQSIVAAATICGSHQSYHPVPWFWSDQADLKLQIAGLSHGYDHLVVRGDLASERFTVLYYRADRLIAADCVNRAPDYMAVRRALAAGQTIPASDAADSTVPLKSLLR